MRRTPAGLGAVALVAAFSFYSNSARADFTVSGQVVGAGGGAATGGSYLVCGTLGQPATGTGARVFRMVCSGFWCFGGMRVVSVDDGHDGALPVELAMTAPMPNPARGAVRFTLALPVPATVAFAVYDVAGRAVGEPVAQRLDAGWHRLEWSAPAGRSGVYFGRLSVDGGVRFERRIVLVR